MTRQTSESLNVEFPEWNSDAFAERLKQAMDGRSAYYLQRGTGIAESLLRKYLSGKSVPGADKLVILARVLGVSLNWLATGEGSQEIEPSPAAATSDAALDSLEDITVKVLELLDRRRPELSAEARGRIVRLVYEFYIRQEKPMDEASLTNVIELAAFR